MTTETTTRPKVSTTEFKQYGKLIAETLVEAINEHGVTYRDLDGTHLRLYCGNRDVMPLKVARSRQPENQIKFILRWLGENVPTWNDRHVTESTLARLREVFNGPEEGTMATTTETPEREVKVSKANTRWVPAKIGPAAKDWGFDTDGTVFRCRTCGFTKQNAQGAHLHEKSHSVEGREEIRKFAGLGGKASREKLKQQKRQPAPVEPPKPEPRVVVEPQAVIDAVREAHVETDAEHRVIHQSLIALAAAHGYSLVEDAEVATLREQLAAAVRERDEYKTRLALVQEAMQA